MAYLYRHIRLDKNEPFYIGVGRSDKNNFKRAYYKHGRSKFWNIITSKSEYEVEIILSNISWEDARNKEVEFIKMYGRRDLGNGTLVNLTDGGDGGTACIISEETRKKISERNKGRIVSEETKKRMSHAQKGKVMSDKAKDNLRKKNLGKKHSESTKIKVSLAGKGRKHTDEAKNKIREKTIGNKRNVGRVMSAETKEKIRKTLLGRKRTDEEKRNISKSLMGRKLSESHKANVILGMKKAREKKIVDLVD